MKHFYLVLVALLITSFGFGQTTLASGDIALIGMDTPAEDFMFVTFTDLDAGTEIYFTDEEADNDFTIGTGEGTYLYTAPAGGITAGTVIVYPSSSGWTNTSDGIMVLGNSGDGILAYQGTSVGNVTTFLHAIGEDSGDMGTFPGGFSNFMTFGADDGEYNGVRTGTALDLMTAINDSANWSTSGSGVVPFDTTSFTISGGCTAPTTQATTYSTTAIVSPSATLNWVRGDGDNVLVVMKETSAVDTDPTDGTTYVANTTFTSGDEIGTGNYVVFNGSGTSVNVTGLTENTTYHVAVYEYATLDTCYNADELTGNFTTLAFTEVQFTSTSISVSEGSGTYDLEFSIANEDALVDTNFNVVLTGGDGDAADINSYSTQSVTFIAGTNTNQTVTLTITDDAIFESDELLTFSIQSIAGGNNAQVGTNATFDLTITNNDIAPPITLPYTEDFSNCGTQEWTPFDQQGDDTWICGSSQYTMNGFPGTDDIDWLISDFRIDFDSFVSIDIDVTTQERFGNTINEPAEFELRYSTDYSGSGDPTLATWTALTFNPNNTSSSSTASAPSTETVDASGISGIAYLAFFYDMTGVAAEEWRILDITITGSATSSNADIVESGFDEPDNIDYASFSATSGLDTTNAIQIGEFTIRDSGVTPTDVDGLDTILTDLEFSIAGFEDIAAIALFNGIANDSEVTTVTATTTFSNIALGSGLTAPDDGSLTFQVYATFKSTVTDNNQIQLTITSATADATGSSFSTADASGAQTTIAGDDNRIEVTATDLIFNVDPTNVDVNTVMSPSPTVLAVDSNVNTDLDFTDIVALTTTGTFNGTTTTSETAIAGETTFSNLLFSTAATGITLTAASGILTDDTSVTFDVIQPPVIIAIEDFDSTTPNWSNDIASQTFVDPTDSDEGLFIQAATTNNSNFSGNSAFGRDLGGESGEPTLSPYIFTFDAVDVSNHTSIVVSFDYHVFANAETGDYEVFIDGVGQGSVEYFNDPDTFPGQNGTISIPVSDGTLTVGLELTGTLNGGSDVLEFDNIKVTGTLSKVYNGNAATGFGGTLGNGSLEVCADSGTTVDFKFNRGTGDFNDYLVIYIDSQAGGITTTTNLTDTGDDGRKAISGFDGSNQSTITFPPGFTPDFAISMNNGFAGLFEIVESGSHTFVSSASLSPTGTNNAAVYSFNINFADINTSAGPESFKFLATYLNPNSVFRSDESIGKNTAAGNPGANPIEFITYFQTTNRKQGGKAPSLANGLWLNNLSWENGNAPLIGDEITINHAINLNTDADVNSVEVTATNSLTVNAGKTLKTSGGITGVGALNVDGQLSITEGGFTDIIPTYSSGSTLVYKDITATYNRFNEWNVGATVGLGVPDNVVIDNSDLDLSNPSGNTTDEDFNIGNDLTLLSSANLNIDATKNLAVGGDLSNTGSTVVMNSTSQRYSSLIISGSSSGNVIYNRYVNSNAPINGNDLISAPVTGQAFNTFIANNTNILTNPSGPEVLFGGFDSNSASNPFELWNETDTTPLVAGKGYRSGITVGASSNLVAFEGIVNTSLVEIAINQGSASSLNLVGNPFPSYLDAQLFLTQNSSLLLPSAQVIYGYNDSTDGTSAGDYTIISSLLNNTLNIAPGQAFFITSSLSGGNLEFTTSTPDMRLTSNDDDFIAGRNPDIITNLKLNLSATTDNFITDIFFTEFSSLGLDPGYDASLLGGSAPAFALYSHLVEDNADVPFAVQALGETDYDNVTIPLGVNASQGEQLTFSINVNTLPNTIEVYLDDTVASTSTLLNSGNYVFTPSVSLNGTGRFFLRFSEEALSTIENELNGLEIYTSNTPKAIIIKGQLTDNTIANLYDIQGRLILSQLLNQNNNINQINTSSISSGIYIVQLDNNNQNRTQKVIIR